MISIKLTENQTDTLHYLCNSRGTWFENGLHLSVHFFHGVLCPDSLGGLLFISQVGANVIFHYRRCPGRASPSCLPSVLSVTSWLGKENMCFCQERRRSERSHFKPGPWVSLERVASGCGFQESKGSSRCGRARQPSSSGRKRACTRDLRGVMEESPECSAERTAHWEHKNG